MSTLNDLKASILADGIIDAEEVKTLKSVLYADGKIDKDEAEFLFDLNDAVSGKTNHETWKTLFVEAITDYLLEDGIIDGDETQWLIAKIQGDGKTDECEMSLLANLKAKVKDMPQELLNLM
jgi:uncharacterized membrane protein YebE (DUF533 family)